MPENRTYSRPTSDMHQEYNEISLLYTSWADQKSFIHSVFQLPIWTFWIFDYSLYFMIFPIPPSEGKRRMKILNKSCLET